MTTRFSDLDLQEGLPLARNSSGGEYGVDPLFQPDRPILANESTEGKLEGSFRVTKYLDLQGASSPDFALKYELSLKLLSQVERRLRSHYRVGGKVCKTLDEAVNALLLVELS